MSKKDIKCWNFGKKRHYTNECKAPKKDKDDNDKISANIALEELDGTFIYSLQSKTESWLLDSGALFHAASSRELF